MSDFDLIIPIEEMAKNQGFPVVSDIYSSKFDLISLFLFMISMLIFCILFILFITISFLSFKFEWFYYFFLFLFLLEVFIIIVISVLNIITNKTNHHYAFFHNRIAIFKGNFDKKNHISIEYSQINSIVLRKNLFHRQPELIIFYNEENENKKVTLSFLQQVNGITYYLKYKIPDKFVIR